MNYTSRWKWTQHLLRKNDTLIEMLASEHIPVGRRNLVRPRKRWT